MSWGKTHRNDAILSLQIICAQLFNRLSRMQCPLGLDDLAFGTCVNLHFPPQC